jgi:hypothetical protein
MEFSSYREKAAAKRGVRFGEADRLSISFVRNYGQIGQNCFT